MPALTTVPVPAGSLGIAFKGKPPTITKVSDTSPLKGFAEVGYVVEALILEDGTELVGLSTKELVKELVSSSTSEGRKLVLQMKVPVSSTVALPTGSSFGVHFVGTPPVVSRIDDDSPFKGKIAVGSVVETLTLQVSVSGLTSEGLEKTLAANSGVEGRMLHLGAQDDDPSMRALPEDGDLFKTTIVLPPGSVGVRFKGSPPKVTMVRDSSPVKGIIHVGSVFSSLTLDDGQELTGLGTSELIAALSDNAESEGRILTLTGVSLPDSITVALPPGTLSSSISDAPLEVFEAKSEDEDDAEESEIKVEPELGLKFVGTPPTITSADKSIPLAKVGSVVESVVRSDGIAFSGLSSAELLDMLNNDSKSDARKLVLRFQLPEVMTVPLPAGKLGITLEGDPPTITSVDEDSPLYGEVETGYIVETLILEDDTEYIGSPCDELVDMLESTTKSEDRKIVIKSPAVATTPPPSINIPLPSGSLGVTFKGTPPTVTSVSDTSVLAGLVKPGYVAEAVSLDDGTVIEDMSTKELIKALVSNADSSGRMLKVRVKLPDTMTVTLPSGDPGIAITGTPPTVTAIQKGSPLKGEIKTGYVVETVTLEDGTSYSGLPYDEIAEVLEANSSSDERMLTIALPEVATMAPPSIECPLPAGSIGLTFKGSPPAVASINPKSPLKDKVKVGYVAEALSLEDGSVKTGFTMHELIKAIVSHGDSSGRKLLFAIKLPDQATIDLPTGKLGVFFKGTPPTVTGFRDESPLKREVQVGYVIEKLILEDGSEYSGMTTSELIEMLGATSEFPGRKMFVSMKAGDTPIPRSAKVMLPAGKLGVSFKGSPPTVSKVAADSPMKGKLIVGYTVESLVLDDGMEVSGLTSNELIKSLSANADSSGRMLIMTGELPDFIMGAPPTMTIPLPAGSLGISFKGTPPVVVNIPLDSPLRGKLKPGYVVEALVLEDGTELDNLSTKQLVTNLGANIDSEGRKLVCSIKIPDEALVELPPGSLGVSFKGSPPMVTKISEDSPLAGKIQTGMIAEILTLGDGTELDELSTRELTGGLKESAGTEGRTILFKNPKA